MANEVYFTGSRSVAGPFALAMGKITCSGLTSGACQLPIGYIDGCTVTINSAISHNTQTVYINKMSAATAADGWIKIGSAIAGDTFGIIAWGRA